MLRGRNEHRDAGEGAPGSRLRVALEQKQFELHYQPKVNTATGVMHGAEALLRWRHPVHGTFRRQNSFLLRKRAG